MEKTENFVNNYLSEKGMSVYQFAEQAGCCHVTIYRILKDYPVTPETYEKIKKATDGKVILWIKKRGRQIGQRPKWAQKILDHEFLMEYRIWFRMMEKCYNERFCEYRNYGAKGITVCKKWLKFEGFIKEMGKIPIGMKSLVLDPFETEFSKKTSTWQVDARKLRAKRMGPNAFRSIRKTKKKKCAQMEFDELGNISSSS